MNALKIQCLRGKEMLPYITDLARLRIEVFKSYPYLYEGDLDYEKKYLQTYLNCPESIVTLVFDHDKVVGASTALPLHFETHEWQKPFIEHHLPLEEIFYLGESVLLPAYRGQGVYKHFFQTREQAARECNCKITTFASVVRPDDHPNKPKNYIPLDAIWKKFGYEKHPELSTQYEWKDINETHPSHKSLVFWLKTL